MLRNGVTVEQPDCRDDDGLLEIPSVTKDALNAALFSLSVTGIHFHIGTCTSTNKLTVK